MDRHEKMIERALKLAATSDHHRYRHGAVVARNRTVLSIGINVGRNKPSIDYQHASVHAEVMALRGIVLGKRTTIYVARVNKLGKPMLSKPCPKCWSHLTILGVDEAVWSTSSGFEVAKLR